MLTSFDFPVMYGSRRVFLCEYECFVGLNVEWYLSVSLLSVVIDLAPPLGTVHLCPFPSSPFFFLFLWRVALLSKPKPTCHSCTLALLKPLALPCRPSCHCWNCQRLVGNMTSSVCPWSWSRPRSPTMCLAQTSALALTRL